MTPDRSPEQDPKAPAPQAGPQRVPSAAHASLEAPVAARGAAIDLDSYDTRRDAVIYGEEVDVFKARETAYDFHGGQFSPLYSFASTEATVWSEDHRAQLEGEIGDATAGVRASLQSGALAEDEGNQQLEDLDNLLRTVKALPARRPSQEGDEP